MRDLCSANVETAARLAADGFPADAPTAREADTDEGVTIIAPYGMVDGYELASPEALAGEDQPF